MHISLEAAFYIDHPNKTIMKITLSFWGDRRYVPLHFLLPLCAISRRYEPYIVYIGIMISLLHILVDHDEW